MGGIWRLVCGLVCDIDEEDVGCKMGEEEGDWRIWGGGGEMWGGGEDENGGDW